MAHSISMTGVQEPQAASAGEPTREHQNSTKKHLTPHFISCRTARICSYLCWANFTMHLFLIRSDQRVQFAALFRFRTVQFYLVVINYFILWLQQFRLAWNYPPRKRDVYLVLPTPQLHSSFIFRVHRHYRNSAWHSQIHRACRRTSAGKLGCSDVQVQLR